MTRICAYDGCEKQIYAGNRSGFCRVHNIVVLRANGLDTNHAKAAESIRAWALSPEGNQKVRAASIKARASWTEDQIALGRTRSGATRKQRHEASLSWCPADRRAELGRLIKAHGAAEGRRIMREDIAFQEKARIAALTPHERALERVREGAPLVTAFRPAKLDYDYTLGGVSGGLL